MKWVLFVCAIFTCCLSGNTLSAQGNILKPQGGRSAALAHNTQTFTDLNALFHNQAGLGFVDKMGAIVSLERRFLLRGLQHASLGFALPVQERSAFGVTTQFFGNPDYSEIKVGLAYGRRLMDNLSIGAQVNYIGVQITEGGSEGVFTFEGGMLAQLLPNTTVGLHVFSPVRVSFSNEYRLPTIIRMTVQYDMSRNVSLYAGVDKDVEQRENIRFGLEYTYKDISFFRIGMGTYPSSVAFGFGFKIWEDTLILDMAAAWNQLLGYTPNLTVGYEF